MSKREREDEKEENVFKRVKTDEWSAKTMVEKAKNCVEEGIEDECLKDLEAILKSDLSERVDIVVESHLCMLPLLWDSLLYEVYCSTRCNVNAMHKNSNTRTSLSKRVTMLMSRNCCLRTVLT